MPGPIVEKLNLWRDSTKGVKTRFHPQLEKAVEKREDVRSLRVQESIERGDFAQRARLKYYPSIDVEKEKLLAGYINGGIEKTEKFLRMAGFRNNPTAYVEVTKDGPDDGSYSRQIITETGARFNTPQVGGFVSPIRRIKDQIHVTIQQVDTDRTDIMAHRERSAWLQPVRHVVVNDSSARRGVRDFRDVWFDTFEQELPGREEVKWEVSN